jgi:hypothetical protein
MEQIFRNSQEFAHKFVLRNIDLRENFASSTDGLVRSLG